MTAAADPLEELAVLLRRQADAARDGDAEALAACSAQIRQRISVLAAGVRPPAAEAAALQALVRQCVRNQALVARRLYAAGRALTALRTAAAAAEPAAPVYGARGTLGHRDQVQRGFGPA